MKVPSTSLLRTFSPLWCPSTLLPSISEGCLALQQKSTFSSTSTNYARGEASRRPKRDPKITQIRYFLSHPRTPRPLRFSRQRSLRHWTIHRAFLLHRSKLRKSRELELERQYNAMREACEALRMTDAYGLTTQEREQLDAPMEGGGKDVGRLFRIAMKKDGVWDGVPIEYARLQTETPPREGYNVDWTR
nr:hypothetical protein CFP56_62896 [Quercus suber]